MVKMEELDKGDLVEVEHSQCNHVDAPMWKVKGIVLGTERDPWVITNHIDVNHFIIPISSVIRIVQKQAIPKKLFKHLVGSLYRD